MDEIMVDLATDHILWLIVEDIDGWPGSNCLLDWKCSKAILCGLTCPNIFFIVAARSEDQPFRFRLNLL